MLGEISDSNIPGQQVLRGGMLPGLPEFVFAWQPTPLFIIDASPTTKRNAHREAYLIITVTDGKILWTR